MKNKNKQKDCKIKTSFTAGTISNYSGILPIYKFMLKLGIVSKFESISLKLGQNASYRTSTILSTVILGIISGLNRLSKMETFSHDPLTRELLSIKDKIDEDTISNRFKKFGMKQNNELMEISGSISSKVREKLKVSYDILDLDSTARTVYGRQEGALVGYNPHKKGARSYHPLLGFLNSTRECILSWLRPGDSFTANNSSEFVKQIFSMLPINMSLLVRTDSGFFDDKLMQVIEMRKHTSYIIKVKLKGLRTLLTEQNWSSIPEMPNWSMTEFQYKAKDWSCPRKFVAMRHKTSETKEGRLFKHSTMAKYRNRNRDFRICVGIFQSKNKKNGGLIS